MALIGQAVSEEKIFEIVDGRTDGRTSDHGHPISSPCEPNGSGELNTRNMKNGTGIGNTSDGVYFNVVDRHECNINFGCMHISHRSMKYLNEMHHGL